MTCHATQGSFTMNLTRTLSIAALCLALPLAASARMKSQEMNDPVTINLETKAKPEQIKKGIKLAVLNRKWDITNEKGSEFDAEYKNTSRAGWSAKIHVSYTPKAVTIKYVSSEGLDADGKNIHPTYNKIIGNLEKDIPIYIEREVVASE
jgi:hypothetical protein